MKHFIGRSRFYEQSALKMFARGEAEWQTLEHEAHKIDYAQSNAFISIFYWQSCMLRRTTEAHATPCKETSQVAWWQVPTEARRSRSSQRVSFLFSYFPFLSAGQRWRTMICFPVSSRKQPMRRAIRSSKPRGKRRAWVPLEERKWGLLPESVPLHVISTVDRSLRSFFQLLTNDKETMLAYFNSLRDGSSERKPQAFPSLWTTVSMITWRGQQLKKLGTWQSDTEADGYV